LPYRRRGVTQPPYEQTSGGQSMTPRDRSDLGARLKRIAGQVGGIQRMLDDDRPLLEVVTQLSAVRAALGGVANIVLASHVEDRANQMLSSESLRERRELISELVQLFEKRPRDS
jgi:DNA-binding FrmR family transcriptional regulator